MIFKLQKRPLRINTNSKYNTHTKPIIQRTRAADIFDSQCMKFCYKFVNKSLPEFFARYLHAIMDYTKSKHAVKTNPTCFLPGLLAHPMFWGIVSQTCCRNILGPWPKRSTLTALSRLSHCLRHISLDLIHMSVLTSIVILVIAMLHDFHCFNCMYQHLMNWISP